MDSYFYFVTGKNKNKLYGGATTNYKKNVRGFTYFYITKLSVIQYVSALG
jgi:hypothetical protein